MNSQDNKKNIELYKELISKHGTSFKSLNWGTQESQELRFKILCESCDVNGKKILDVGCGLADLYAFLLKNNYREFTYTGIDITKEMIESSKKRFPETELLHINLDELDQSYDCIVASGIFTYQSNHFLQQFISTAFSKANEVLAFNALSSWASDQEAGEFYADPLATLEYCRTISPWVSLRHDYHSRDFTIYMYKNRNI